MLVKVLNHREGSTGTRLKPDFISALELARERMASAVEPPPEYFSPDDTCHVQHTSEGYSKQVMPRPFQAYDRPEVATDDTMILLDVSGQSIKANNNLRFAAILVNQKLTEYFRKVQWTSIP